MSRLWQERWYTTLFKKTDIIAYIVYKFFLYLKSLSSFLLVCSRRQIHPTIEIRAKPLEGSFRRSPLRRRFSNSLVLFLGASVPLSISFTSGP